MYTVEKEFEISCSHRLHNLFFSEEENKKVFGKCANEPSHGHNYIITLELSSMSLIDDMVLNFSKIKEIFNEKIDKEYDHKFLNSCPLFEYIIPTAENMARVFFNLLIGDLPNLTKVTVQEASGARASYKCDH
jgi:6-pyruvoyltetrahydropterin/6-carboxytetrahydropterin synthase